MCGQLNLREWALWKSSDFRNGQLDIQQRDLRVFALNRKTITQRRKDAMAQGTKVSGYISLGFSIVPVLPTQNSGEPIFIVQK